MPGPHPPSVILTPRQRAVLEHLDAVRPARSARSAGYGPSSWPPMVPTTSRSPRAWDRSGNGEYLAHALAAGFREARGGGYRGRRQDVAGAD